MTIARDLVLVLVCELMSPCARSVEHSFAFLLAHSHLTMPSAGAVAAVAILVASSLVVLVQSGGCNAWEFIVLNGACTLCPPGNASIVALGHSMSLL